MRIEENHLLFIKDDETKIRYHLEDIDLVMIDNIKSIITIQCLNSFSKNNVSLIINNISHEPEGLFLPFNTHHKPVRNFKLQIDLNDHIKKLLHQKTICKKIENQLGIMRNVLILNDDSEEKMDFYIKNVLIGDSSNREGHAAKLFFKNMYGSNFVRFSDDGINNALNFGYKILASRISSSIVKYGLHPSLGYIHITETNYFNLTYDFIEPFRPIVDYFIKMNSSSIVKELSLNTRLNLLRILDYPVFIGNKMMKLRNGIDFMVKSYVSFLNSKKLEDFQLPTINVYELELEEIENEEYDEY